MQLARAAKRYDMRAQLGRISVPTLLVITNCGHAPMLERPEPLTEIVEEWLRESRIRHAVLRASYALRSSAPHSSSQSV
jgi:hypothetical protein